MPSTTRGALIVIEGLDRAGKSTQCERLCSNLEQRGHSVKRRRFPDRSTAIGAAINAYLRNEGQLEDHAVHLLFSANRWEAAALIRADIEAGVTVVVDRYYYSGMVYSAAKPGANISLAWARQPDVGLPRPDLCIFLDIEPEVAEKRGGFGEERYEDREMMGRVRSGFYELMKEDDGADIKITDAGRGLDEVELDVLTVVEGMVWDRVKKSQLRTLLPWGNPGGEEREED